MSDENNGKLSDQEKIDRAAWHEELRFYKKQQWAVPTAGVVLLGGFLTIVGNVRITALDKFFAVILIFLTAWAGWFLLDDLQESMAKVRRTLDSADRHAETRDRVILGFHKFVLVATGLVVAWAVLFKLPL
jgi:hypothetical protein